MEEENENLLHQQSPKPKPSDDKMSLAIINLQAMLGTDDIDLVIRLLEENAWDETSAANAFFAQEFGNNRNQTREET